MKKFKKLIPALCMLFVSAVMLGSSTFAWFSMNNKVTATGLDVTAKANTQYFVISESTDFTANNTQIGLTKPTNTKLFPASYLKDADAVTALENRIDGKKYTSGDSPAVGDWYTANSKQYNVSSTSLGNVKKIENGSNAFSKTDYFAKYSFYVGLAANSSEFEDTLTISVVPDENNAPNDAINAVVVITGKTSKSATSAATIITNGIFSETDDKITADYYMSTTDYLFVEVYVYVDGDHANVKDTEIDNLKGTFNIIVEKVA